MYANFYSSFLCVMEACVVFAFSILFKLLHYLNISKTRFTFIIRKIQNSSILENKHSLLNLHDTSVFQL